MSPTLRRLRYATHRWRRRWAGRAQGMQRVRAGQRLELPEADYALHMLLCHHDVEMGLWCLKSFSHFAQASPAITVHDDGTLTPRDVDDLERQLARCRIVRRAEADARMRSALAGHPHSLRMRNLPGFHCALKLFDPWVYAPTERIVLLDSDVLFFREPRQLVRCVRGGPACFLADYQESYAVPVDALQRSFDLELLPRVNAGLLVLGRADHEIGWIEEYFARFPAAVPDPNRHEQTLYALLLSRAKASRLDPDYQISSQAIGPGTVSHHFVNDGSRIHFSTRGLRTLRRRGLLETINGRGAPADPEA